MWPSLGTIPYPDYPDRSIPRSSFPGCLFFHSSWNETPKIPSMNRIIGTTTKGFSLEYCWSQFLGIKGFLARLCATLITYQNLTKYQNNAFKLIYFLLPMFSDHSSHINNRLSQTMSNVTKNTLIINSASFWSKDSKRPPNCWQVSITMQ